jgi:hypothetical protein
MRRVYVEILPHEGFNTPCKRAVMNYADYRLMLSVVRAADGLKYDSGVRVKWPDWLLPLEAALDAFNGKKK